MSAHDSSVCQSGFAVQQWASQNGVTGYATVDIGKSGWAANYILGASGNGKANFGQADVIFWGIDGIYIWEVKPNNTYGKTDGPIDLARYVSKLQNYLISVGDSRLVRSGPGVGARPFVSKEGSGRVWSGDPVTFRGMRFYGTDKPRGGPGAQPDPGPSSTVAPSVTQSPEPRPVPNPTPLPSPVPGVRGSGGFGLAAFVEAILKIASQGVSEGPACTFGGNC